MGRIIKINCQKVYKTGLLYMQDAEQLKSYQEELRKVLSNVKDSWQGADSNNFAIRVEQYIESLDDIVIALEEKSDVLKSSALNHNTVDNEFLERMNRSEMENE